jgi:CHAT domain-containing protein
MNLGQVALRRGDLSKADDLFQRSLALYEPGSTFASWGLQARGEVAERRGQWQAAEAFNKEALAIITKHAPEGLDQAAYLQSLGRVAEGQGNLAGAEGFYHHALRIRQRLVSGTQFEAESLHGLGVVARKRGDLGTAEALLRRAADVLEIQKGRLGGAEDVQSRFAGSYSDFYQDLLELLVGRNDVASAFAVLERSRARRLLTLMAQRDLILDDEIPAPLERERRRVDADYERAKNELRQLSPEKNAADVARIVIRLRELRDAKADVADRIREASPRLAGFTDPRPLDAELLAASLEPGTLLLEYAVGKDATVLLMLGNATPAEAAVIPIGEARLAERVERWRRWAEQTAPPDEFFAEGRALYDLLVLPAERHVRRAQHLLVSPDGPLHRLPFAALQHDQAHLAERKALTVTPSGTISAQLARSRGSIASDVDLVAFGDPRIDGSRPLTASRREVEALAGLFPRSRAYLGDDASADRARAGLKHARYVHFACHGLIDERFPLDSALALAGSDGSGLLHAWEIFERVRLNADLVTLSACRSASGTSFAGEGLLGLTRAFQFAGARSVLASLWDTGDRSTLQIMTRFYALVKAGVSKDEALRRAQVEAIRRGWHPVRWANFQLYGDWR